MRSKFLLVIFSFLILMMQAFAQLTYTPIYTDAGGDEFCSTR